jgi:hypothetical protein
MDTGTADALSLEFKAPGSLESRQQRIQGLPSIGHPQHKATRITDHFGLAVGNGSNLLNKAVRTSAIDHSKYVDRSRRSRRSLLRALPHRRRITRAVRGSRSGGHLNARVCLSPAAPSENLSLRCLTIPLYGL